MLGLSQLQLYVAGALLLALIGLGAANIWQHHENAALNKSLGSCEANLVTAIGANKDLKGTIETQKGAIEKWKEAATVSDYLKAQAALAAAYRLTLAAQKAELAKLKARASVDCQAYLRGDLEGLCPDLGAKLRSWQDD